MAHPDLLFGALAIKARYITRDQLESLLAEQGRNGAPLPLGELCQKQGLLTSSQVMRVLEAQKLNELEEEGKLFGVLAVRNGFVTLADIDRALDLQKEADLGGRGAAPLGEILLQMGKLGPQQVTALLEAQERLRKPAEPETRDPDSETRRLSAVAVDPLAESTPAWLIEEAPDGLLRAHPLREKTVIGRHPGQQVPVADMSASRNHARIDFSPYTCKHVLADLGSRNGTFVNDERLTHPRALRPGDRILVGNTQMRYAVGAGVDLSRGGTDVVRISASGPVAPPPPAEETDPVPAVAPPSFLKELHLQRKCIAAAAALGLVATFLPWSHGRLGALGPGWATFLLFALVGALALFQDRRRPLARDLQFAVLAVGTLAALFAVWRWARGSPGIGIFVALGAGLGATVPAFLGGDGPRLLSGLLRDLTGRRARERAEAVRERDRLLLELADAAGAAKIPDPELEAVKRAAAQVATARSKASEARLLRARLKLGRAAVEKGFPLPDGEARIARIRELDRSLGNP